MVVGGGGGVINRAAAEQLVEEGQYVLGEMGDVKYLRPSLSCMVICNTSLNNKSLGEKKTVKVYVFFFQTK